jgi:hypothetical protein
MLQIPIRDAALAARCSGTGRIPLSRIEQNSFARAMS